MHPEKVARDLIAKGFCKNIASDGKGAYCAVGAVKFALDFRLTEAETVVRELYDYIPAEFQTVPVDSWSVWDSDAKWSCVVAFNNHPKTTQEDVVGAFDKMLADKGII